jgi:DNA polymerase (family 10)
MKNYLDRKEVEEIIKILKEENQNVDFEVLGSWIRGKEKIGDLDILMDVKDDLDLFGFKRFTYITKGTKIQRAIIFHNNKEFQIDIYKYKDYETEYIPTYSFLVGSGMFNVVLRNHAKKLGYVLSQNGLRKNGKEIPLDTEEELFNELGLKIIPFEKREIKTFGEGKKLLKEFKNE